MDPDDKKKDALAEADSGEVPDTERRRFLYAAPVILTARLFNSVAGCGRSSPTDRSCSLLPRTS
jgi:hypothetical protein